MYDYSGSREEFSKDAHLSDEQILEIVDAIHRMVKSNDLEDEIKSYINEYTIKLLGEIAGG